MNLEIRPTASERDLIPGAEVWSVTDYRTRMVSCHIRQPATGVSVVIATVPEAVFVEQLGFIEIDLVGLWRAHPDLWPPGASPPDGACLPGETP